LKGPGETIDNIPDALLKASDILEGGEHPLGVFGRTSTDISLVDENIPYDTATAISSLGVASTPAV
jgi:hypothetical protein